MEETVERLVERRAITSKDSAEKVVTDRSEQEPTGVAEGLELGVPRLRAKVNPLRELMKRNNWEGIPFEGILGGDRFSSGTLPDSPISSFVPRPMDPEFDAFCEYIGLSKSH